ncbi:MAG: hypothetical protein ACREOF_19785 [Gemmatimonadales bacterium]
MGDDDREVRRAQIALGAALGLALAGIGFALLLRYGPARGDSAGPGPLTAQLPEDAPTGELSVVTAGTTLAESLASAPDSALPATAPRVAPAAVTDVVLLPCTEPNPRPDGSFLIPPHDPTHRTIVGLPSRPGEPKWGLLIPPHDPGAENRIPVQRVPMDSILEHTIRIAPHDPGRFKLVRPDTLPCLNW